MPRFADGDKIIISLGVEAIAGEYLGKSGIILGRPSAAEVGNWLRRSGASEETQRRTAYWYQVEIKDSDTPIFVIETDLSPG